MTGPIKQPAVLFWALFQTRAAPFGGMCCVVASVFLIWSRGQGWDLRPGDPAGDCAAIGERISGYGAWREELPDQRRWLNMLVGDLGDLVAGA